MGVERIWKWKCDGVNCQVVVSCEDYGLPKGWIFVKGMTTTHRCPSCIQGVDKNKIGYPQVVAKK